MLPGPPKGTSHVGPVQVFPQVHQRQKCAQNSGLQIIGQVQTAGGHTRQSFAAFRDKTHDFFLPFVRSVSQRRLPPHLCAACLDRQRKVQNTNLLLLGQGWRRVVLTSRYFARHSHGARNLGPTRKLTTPRPENLVPCRQALRILHSLLPHPVPLPPIPPGHVPQKTNPWSAFKNNCIKMQ
jgi:hypothetical protein